MSARDIESLCCLFYNVPFEELHSMDNLNVPWLMPIKGLSLLPAVERIRDSLKAIPGEPERLQCTATLYSWLIQRGVYRQWALYRLNSLLQDLDPRTVGVMLTKAVQSCGNGVGDGVLDIGTALCFTVLMGDETRIPFGFSPICFCIWRGLPFLAVHAPGMDRHQATHSTILASVIGDLETHFQGIYGDLSSALSEATRSRLRCVKAP